MVPRAAPSKIIPLPRVDRPRLLSAFKVDKLRAARAFNSPLRADIRAVGELFRREQVAPTSKRHLLQERLVALVRENLLLGRAEDLACLRALQSRLFYEALQQKENKELASKSLAELARGFELPQNSFRLLDGTLGLDAVELNLLFKFRWSQITRTLEVPGLRPSLNETRAYYGLLLKRPPGTSFLSKLELTQKRIPLSQALGRIDPQYPSNLTKGILLYRLGDPASATAATAAYLASAAEGRWGLLAQTHLRQSSREMRGVW